MRFIDIIRYGLTFRITYTLELVVYEVEISSIVLLQKGKSLAFLLEDDTVMGKAVIPR